jgi:hypothetical protein
MDSHQRILEETGAARARAVELLRSLEAARAELDPTAKDLYKRVTGQSSIENSIAAARRAVEAYDRVLAELAGGEAPIVTVPPAGAPRPGARP